MAQSRVPDTISPQCLMLFHCISFICKNGNNKITYLALRLKLVKEYKTFKTSLASYKHNTSITNMAYNLFFAFLLTNCFAILYVLGFCCWWLWLTYGFCIVLSLCASLTSNPVCQLFRCISKLSKLQKSTGPKQYWNPSSTTHCYQLRQEYSQS